MMYQVLVKRGKISWFPIGPLCYTEEEAKGYADFHAKWCASLNRPTQTTIVPRREADCVPRFPELKK